jgi:hypothetical protein
VILGIVCEIKANRGGWAAYPTIANGSPQRSILIAICLVTALRCSNRNASDTIIRLL